MNKVPFLALFCLLALALCLSCAKGARDTGLKTITVAQDQTVKILDPHDTNQVVAFNAQAQIFTTLVARDKDLRFIGGLAESWRTISDTEWEFKLRRGVKWHDGSDFTAEDVIFSIRRQQGIARNSYRVASIESIDAVDPYTLRIRTKGPDGTLLVNLSGTASSILPKKAVTELGDDFKKKPIGTGPMRVVEWVENERLVLEKNKDYFLDVSSYADRLIFIGIPEGSARTIALETGEVDLINSVESVDKKRIAAHKELSLREEVIPRVDYFAFNLRKPPFNNPLVRKALSHAIDKASINIVHNDGKGRIAYTVVGPPTLGFTEEVERYDYDPAKAKALLVEAGFPKGFKMTIWASGEARNRIAQIIQANFAAIGVEAQIDLLEWASYVERTGAGEHEAFILGWSANGDGDLALYPQFHSSRQGAPGNRAFYVNPRVDALLDEARIRVSLEERARLYSEAQRLIVADAPWVPLYYPTMDIGYRKGLKGLDESPLGLGTIDYHKLRY